MNILLSTTTTDTLNILISIAFIIISYLFGSIPFGLVIGKGIKHIDIREHGSKNIGTTNSIRVLGKKLGFFVFFCDVFKGMAIILTLKLLNHYDVWNTPIDYIWYGAAAILGHAYSIFLDFKGGKVVATSLGVVFVLCPTAAILCLIVFVLTLKITGYVSLGSTFAALTVLITGWLLYAFGVEPTNFFNFFISKISLSIAMLFTFGNVLIFLKHIKNYKRLLNGTENSFKKKKTA